MQLSLGIEIFYFVALIISIILHEVAHGYAAQALGDPTAKLAGRLTLNPVSHIDLMGSIIIPLVCVVSGTNVLFGWAKPVPYNPHNLRNQRWGEALVSGAGVAINLALALLFGLLSRFLAASGADAAGTAAALVALVNLSLGFFNLIPLPPLDGYGIVRGVLPYRYAVSFRAFEDRMRAGGIVTLIVILLAFNYLLAGPFSLLVQYVFHFLTGH